MGVTPRLRLQVDEHGPEGTRTTVAYIGASVAPALVAQLEPIIADAVAALPNLTASDARLLLAGEVAKLVADEAAYDRECARRGVLAL